MNTSIKNIVNKAFIFFLLYAVQVSATHNVSRYLPFLERPEDYTIKNRSHFSPNFFYVNASTSRLGNDHTRGIPEVWGMYDLMDVINSYGTVQQGGHQAVLLRDLTLGNRILANKSIRFRVDSKIRGVGLMLGYEHDLKWAGLQVGISIPVIALNTTGRFTFERDASDAFFMRSFTQEQIHTQDLLVDAIRRKVHQLIGFEGNEWEKAGFGDIDFHIRWNRIFDHVLLMRSIDLNIQAGVIAPTGSLSNFNLPTSISVGSDGHWGIYGDIVTAFELKQDITVGLMLGGVYLFPNTRTRRIPVANEPAIFSALIGRAQVSPGYTFKISPYFILGNLTDGLDFQVRYTYLHHGIDRWKDKRSDKTVKSYLQRGQAIINSKQQLSKWTSPYASLQLSYDSKVGMQCWTFDPTLFATYDVPMGGYGAAQTHQITVGVELHF